MGNAIYRPVAEISERQPRTVFLNPLLQQGTPQNRHDLRIQKRRGKQGGSLDELTEPLA